MYLPLDCQIKVLIAVFSAFSLTSQESLPIFQLLSSELLFWPHFILSGLSSLPHQFVNCSIADSNICQVLLILSGNPVIFALPGSHSMTAKACVTNTWCSMGRYVRKSWAVSKPVVHSFQLESQLGVQLSAQSFCQCQHKKTFKY